MPQFVFEAIGTSWKIYLYETVDNSTQSALIKAIHARIAIFDKDYSRFRDDSLVAEMSRKAGTYTLPADGKVMMDMYRDLYQATDGLITPLIGQVISDAGYDAQYSLVEKDMHVAPHWDDVIEYDFPQLTLRQPALLDFGSVGKGYLIDIVAQIISEHGIKKFCIDAGGDMLYSNSGGGPLRVGLENPNDFSQAIGVVSLASGSLCGSSGSRRKWGRFHHIIDPYKLESPRDIIATWVTAPQAIVADALATALFFVSADKIKSSRFDLGISVLRSNLDDFEWLVLYSDMSVQKSANFPAELFGA